MLNIYFGEMEEAIYNPAVYFKNTYDPEWFETELARKMVEDIDHSNILSSECISSPVLGQIPPERLSGGVKTLLLILNEPDKIFNASACGDNCAKWLLEIGKTFLFLRMLQTNSGTTGIGRLNTDFQQ